MAWSRRVLHEGFGSPRVQEPDPVEITVRELGTSSWIKGSLLEEMVPSGLTYGGIYYVEYESDSLWYETSLTIVGQALKQGLRADYHTFQHVPAKVREDLVKLGLDVKRLEEENILRVMDSYSSTTVELPQEEDESRLPWGSRSLKLTEWRKAIAEENKRGLAPIWKRRLHVDDDHSPVVQCNDEKGFIDFLRTLLIPHVRRHEYLMIGAVLAGVFSASFYKQIESLCDGIIEFKSQEEGGQIERYARVRHMRGSAIDSRWKRLQLHPNGIVSLEIKQEMDKPFESNSPLIDYLIRAFIDDYMHRRLDLQQSGWRSLPEIARTLKIPQSQLYGDTRYQHRFGGALEMPIAEGLVEYRFFKGKGRGGEVQKVRVQYDREPMRRLVDSVAFRTVPKKT